MKFTDKIRNLCKKSKMFVTVVVSAVAMSAMAIVASAEDPVVDSTVVQTALTSGLSDTAKTILLCVAAIIPIALGIFSAKKVIAFAKQFFSKIAG